MYIFFSSRVQGGYTSKGSKAEQNIKCNVKFDSKLFILSSSQSVQQKSNLVICGLFSFIWQKRTIFQWTTFSSSLRQKYKIIEEYLFRSSYNLKGKSDYQTQRNYLTKKCKVVVIKSQFDLFKKKKNVLLEFMFQQYFSFVFIFDEKIYLQRLSFELTFLFSLFYFKIGCRQQIFGIALVYEIKAAKIQSLVFNYMAVITLISNINTNNYK